MDVSVVIVNWNTKQMLDDCLASVFEQTEELRVEVMVVDNASADGSQDMVRAKYPQVELIDNPLNLGFAAANNQAIPKAKGKYVLLLNPDTVVLDGAIEKAYRFAEQNEKTAVTGVRVLNGDKSLQPSCFMYPSFLNWVLSSSYLYKLFPRNKFFARERMGWWDRNDVRDVEVVTGCFMLVRREAIEQVGAMDDAYFMFGEETDWCYRFKQAGWRIMFTPDAEIIHFGAGSTAQMRSEMTLQLRGSILLFIRKHKSKLEYAACCVMVSLFFLMRVPYWFLKSVIDRKGSAGRIFRTYLKGAVGALGGADKLCVKVKR